MKISNSVLIVVVVVAAVVVFRNSDLMVSPASEFVPVEPDSKPFQWWDIINGKAIIWN